MAKKAVNDAVYTDNAMSYDRVAGSVIATRRSSTGRPNLSENGCGRRRAFGLLRFRAKIHDEDHGNDDVDQRREREPHLPTEV